MFKPLKTGILSVLAASALVTGAAAVTSGAGTVTAPSVNVRASGSMSSAVVTTVPRNTALLVSESGYADWCRVACGGGEGYIYSRYLDLSSELEADFGYGKALSDSLVIYVRPSESSAPVGSCGRGAIVRICGVSDSWLKVEFEDYSGYVLSDSVELGHSEDEYGVCDTMCFIISDAWVYSSPDAESETLRYCAVGERLEVLSTASSDWYKVRSGDNVGYISPASLITYAAEDDGVGADIISEALKYMGIPYVYGGTSPSGFDCSGFVYYLYHQFGYGITRRASTIWYDGQSVSQDELKPGDPVFFSNYYSSSIEHVGLYIGNGLFIHSPSTGKTVSINTLSEGYYQREYYGAVHINGVD